MGTLPKPFCCFHFSNGQQIFRKEFISLKANSFLYKQSPFEKVLLLRDANNTKLRNLFPFVSPTALRKAETVYNFGLSECNRVKNWQKDM